MKATDLLIENALVFVPAVGVVVDVIILGGIAPAVIVPAGDLAGDGSVFVGIGIVDDPAVKTDLVLFLRGGLRRFRSERRHGDDREQQNRAEKQGEKLSCVFHAYSS